MSVMSEKSVEGYLHIELKIRMHKMTNFEKIKSMSIGELVEKLDKVFTCEHYPHCRILW